MVHGLDLDLGGIKGIGFGDGALSRLFEVEGVNTLSLFHRLGQLGVVHGVFESLVESLLLG